MAGLAACFLLSFSCFCTYFGICGRKMGCCTSNEKRNSTHHQLYNEIDSQDIKFDDDASLPVNTFQTEIIYLIVGPDIASSEKICSICLDKYTVGEYVELLECGHYYHSLCLDQWKNQREKTKKGLICPECRAGTGYSAYED